MNEKEVRRSLIICAMHRKKVNKRNLSNFLNLSYPTMLHKLKNPEEFKIGQAKRLCEYLNIELTELLNIKNYKNE
jgi:DNA-binding Xre family transcriptional regulator